MKRSNNNYQEKDKVGDEVVVMGGRLDGCEYVIHPGMEGKKVRHVEMRDVLAPDANVCHRTLMLKEMDKYIEVFTEHKAWEVTIDGVLCENVQGEKMLVPGKSIICAMGQKPNCGVVEALKDSALYVRVIGDVERISAITNTVYFRCHAALDI